ncbi:MAG: MBL fold metallo-hydrolase [Candidatus Kapabacteria bacterium]|nr:MBL fold metallo-hydrolase [Candidatus Kapabacteria bacterium]
MRVTKLTKHPTLYSCNVYLVRGNWNTLEDKNTLIDVGTDGEHIINEIETISTGVGKKRIEQILITHEHFDHAGGLSILKKKYNPIIYSFTKIPCTDILLNDGLHLKIGDKDALVIHTPGHSNDSVCFYVKEEKALFSGDTPINIKSAGGTYTKDFVEVMKRFCKMEIEFIYAGHEDPVEKNAKDMLEFTLKNILKSQII